MFLKKSNLPLFMFNIFFTSQLPWVWIGSKIQRNNIVLDLMVLSRKHLDSSVCSGFHMKLRCITNLRFFSIFHLFSITLQVINHLCFLVCSWMPEWKKKIIFTSNLIEEHHNIIHMIEIQLKWVLYYFSIHMVNDALMAAYDNFSFLRLALP